ncbi:hypothetical protein T10_10478 [Trichinella papuae]|uniref:Uncharacterized protein n=1 Tax=Trichinella papuae TaxID=268474 RepID=A0A0V1MTG0_9BILA|nr:hypothetical protein T10_10478 [Trichinella papuae]
MVCWPRRTDGNDQRRCDSGDLFCSNGADLSICHVSYTADAGQRTTTASKQFSKQKDMQCVCVCVLETLGNAKEIQRTMIGLRHITTPPHSLQHSNRFSVSQSSTTVTRFHPGHLRPGLNAIFFSLQTSFNLHMSSLNVVANYSCCFATSIPMSMLLGGHPLNDWSMKFNDQVHRLSKLQKNMVHLSRRIGPRQHGLLIDLVNLHDRLRSLTSHFQRNLLHFQRDLSPLIETEKNMLKSTVPHVKNKNAIDNTSFHASTSVCTNRISSFFFLLDCCSSKQQSC